MVNPVKGLRAILRDIGERGATMLGALFSGGRALGADRNAKAVLANTKNQPWLMAVTNRIARTAASQEWEVYRTRGANAARTAEMPRGARLKAYGAKQQQTDWQKLDSSPLLDFINGGNDQLPGHQVQKLTYQYLDLVGECFWLIERGASNRPVAAWPIPACWVETPATPSQPFYKISVGGWRDNIPASDVIYFRDAAPNNPYGRGLGMACTLADELETDEYASKHIAAFFKNRARPDFLVMGKLSPADTKRLEREWVAESRGFWNAFKPRFLSGTDFQVHEMSQSFKSMEFVALRKFGRDYVAQVLGVPLEIMGIIENSNRATIDAADYLFMAHTVLPRLELFRSTLQRSLVPEFGAGLSLEYVDPVPEDRQFTLDTMNKTPWCYTVDEWRAQSGHDPLAEQKGEVFMVPVNLYAMREPGGAEPEPEPQTPEGAVQEVFIPSILGVDFAKEGGDETVRLEFTGDTFQTVNREVVYRLDEADVQQIVDAVDPADLTPLVRSALTDTVARFGQQALEELGFDLDFDLLDPNVTAFLRESSSTRIANLYNETTRQAIRDALADAVEEGLPMGKIQNRIVDVFDAARGYRSHNIARTETNRAANFGAYEGYRDAGVQRVQWVATRGVTNHRWTHEPGAGLDLQIRPLGQRFQSPSGATALYPGDFGVAAEDCQCQCRVVGYTGQAFTEQHIKALWASFQQEQQPLIRSMRRGLRRGFDKQQRAALAELRRVTER